MVYFPFLFTNRLYCTKNISIVHVYVYKNALNWQTLAYIFFLLWKVVKASQKMYSENKPLKTTHMHISSFVKISVCLLLLILTIHYTVLHACVSVAYQRLPFTRPWIWGFTFLLSFWSVLLFLFVCLFVFCLVCVLFFRFLFF